MTGQKGNGGTGQGGDSSGSDMLLRNLGPSCVKTEEGPSNQLSHILCPLWPHPATRRILT